MPEVKKIQLRGPDGCTLTIAGDFDFFELRRRERELVTRIAGLLHEYEREGMKRAWKNRQKYDPVMGRVSERSLVYAGNGLWQLECGHPVPPGIDLRTQGTRPVLCPLCAGDRP